MSDMTADGAARDPGLSAAGVAGLRQGRRVSRRTLLAAGAALLFGSAAAYYGHAWWTEGRFIESTDDAYVGGDVTALAPKVAGTIASVPVTDNQAVKAGDLLVKLDDRDYRAALAKAEAGVVTQQARLASNLASHALQVAITTQTEAALEATAAQLAVTRFDVDRYRALAHDQFSSVQRFQQADADQKKAAAADVQAHAALTAAQRQTDVIDAARAEIVAALAAAVADRDTARLNLGYTEIRAPIDGVIGNRSARIGSYVSAGSQMLSLVPSQGLWVDANFKESQLAHFRPGMKVTVVVDVLPGEALTGHVASLAPATGAVFSLLPAENATGNFTKIVQRVPVRVLLDGDASRLGRLRPGLSVTASVDAR